MARLLKVLLLLAAMALPLTPAVAQLAAPAEGEAASEEAGGRTDLELLIDVIEDDAARAALLEELRAAAAGADGAGDALAEEADPSETASFGRQLANVTQAAAEVTADRLATIWTQLTRAPAVFEGLSGDEATVLLQALRELLLVIAGTATVFVLLRRGGKVIYARMSAAARHSGAARAALLFVVSVLIDVLIVVVAWAAGYALAVGILGEFGQIGIRQTLYLNAFLLVEMARVVVRLVLSPSATHLRLMPISDAAAAYVASRVSLIVSVVGYGQLLVVPIINANVSYAAGRAVSSLIACAVLAFAVWLVLRNRRPVAVWLIGANRRLVVAETAGPVPGPAPSVPPAGAVPADMPGPVADEAPATDPVPPRRRGAFAAIARYWHWPALAYLFFMFLVVLIRPGEAAFQTFLASGQVLLLALAGTAISALLTRTMARGVVLPAGVSTRLPLLERRLNRIVPRALFVLRIAIVILVLLLALNALQVIDLRGWLASQVGLRLTGILVSVTLVLIVSFAIWIALASWVDYRLNPESGMVATARERTLLTLLRNAGTIALIIITTMFVLAEIGLDIAPLLASAGVLGLAIGFGAQKMVQDIITGIFIQFENAMNVGDVVTVGGTSGVVERLTVRSVSLRDLSGAFHIIPFSSVDMVTNYVRDFGYYLCDMGVAYREDVDEVKQAMLDAFAALRADPEHAAFIMDDLEWFGLESFGDSAVVLRARIKCIPGQQWGIGRAYNRLMKQIFDARGIEIPFPHQTIYLGESKDGRTQSVRVDLDGAAGRAA